MNLLEALTKLRVIYAADVVDCPLCGEKVVHEAASVMDGWVGGYECECGWVELDKPREEDTND